MAGDATGAAKNATGGVAVRDWLDAAAARLAPAHRLSRREALLEARLLLGRVLDAGPAWFISHDTDAVAAPALAAAGALLDRRLAGEPVAYLLGEWEFYGLALAVNPAVLIPRPETEVLVGQALRWLDGFPAPRVLDLGTGSGAIAVAVAANCRNAVVTAVDESAAALAVARANADRHGLRGMELLRSDWYEAVAGRRFDLIAANPPYIADADPHLAALRFEPSGALTSGADGLDDIRAIVAGAERHLAPSGRVIIEHGHDQGDACRTLMRASGLADVATLDDLNGTPRFTHGRRPPPAAA